MNEAEISKLCVDRSTFFVTVEAHQQHLHRYDRSQRDQTEWRSGNGGGGRSSAVEWQEQMGKTPPSHVNTVLYAYVPTSPQKVCKPRMVLTSSVDALTRFPYVVPKKGVCVCEHL